MIKILEISHNLLQRDNDFSLYKKIIEELEKYFFIKEVCFYQEENIKKKTNNKYYKINWHSLPKYLRFIFIFKMVWINIKEIKGGNSDVIHIPVTSSVNNFFIFIYPLLFRQSKFLIQTFTPSVDKNKFKRFFLDYIISLNFKLYKNIVGNVERNIKAYRLKPSQIVSSNIGVYDYSLSEKNFEFLKLLYIGTLNTREVWKTVEGLALFVKRNLSVKITYDIIGKGNSAEVKKIIDLIEANNLKNIVYLHGYLSTEEVQKFFDKCNVGISYVPITNRYGFKSTKTLEYLIAGMPVIVTNGGTRNDLVDVTNGVLIDDTPEDFSDGLERLWMNRHSYKPNEIREKYEHETLENTIKNDYAKVISNLGNNKR